MRPVDDPGPPNHPSGRGGPSFRGGPPGPPPRAGGPPGPGYGPPRGPAPDHRAGPPTGGSSGRQDGGGAADTGLAGAEGFASRTPRSRHDGSAGTTSGHRAGGNSGRHRRDGADDEPGQWSQRPDDDGDDESGTRGGKKKRKGSFWRELPLLIVVALVLTFVIQTFVGRIYVIPSGSMEKTLHGCTGCSNDRVAVDKLTYRFSDPAPGDVVVFRGPPTWASSGEETEQQSNNTFVRGLQQALSLIGLAPPDERDFVKRVIAVGGQTVACCDNLNRVTVDGHPLTEPYIYYQPGFGQGQAPFDPITVPAGQLWVMGDNRNNSADARAHGPIGVTDVIGKARAIVLPVNRWGGVPAVDPQTQPAALGAPGWSGAVPPLAGLVLAVPTVWGSRRLRARLGADTSTSAPPDPAPTVADDRGTEASHGPS